MVILVDEMMLIKGVNECPLHGCSPFFVSSSHLDGVDISNGNRHCPNVSIAGELVGHKGLVSSFSFCQHAGLSHLCVSSSNDGSVLFWDSGSRVLVKEHGAHQVGVNVSSEEKVPMSDQTPSLTACVRVLRAPSQLCTGPRWTRTWWCRGMRRESWCVTGTTQETQPASSLSPGPSSASAALLTPGALWL